jgi:DNA polymerase III delta prime subunit
LTNPSVPQPLDAPKKAPRKSAKKPKKDVLVEGSNAAATPSAPEGEHGQAELLEVDPNNSRRKRRKTDSPGTEEATKEATEVILPKKKGRPSKADSTSPSKKKVTATPIQATILVDGGISNNSAQALPNASSISNSGDNPTILENGTTHISSGTCPPTQQEKAKGLNLVESAFASTTSTPKNAIDDKPKKILRLNPKTGTIGSPPAKKPPPAIEAISRSSARGKTPKSRIVTILYGPSERLPLRVGHKIEQILNGAMPVSIEAAPSPPKIAKPAPTQPPKALHPLFMGKAAPKEAPPKSDAEGKASKSEVVDLTEPTILGRARVRSIVQPSSPPKPRVAFAGFGKSPMILKFPGAVEPAWPWQGMVHVRGNTEARESSSASKSSLQIRSNAKKSKYQAVQIVSDEDVIATLAKDLNIKNVVESIRETHPDEFPPLPCCLRLPTKHYEGGSALQQRARKELRTKFSPPKPAQSDSSEDEIQTKTPTSSVPHPALAKVYNLIPGTLSYFDKGQCETQSWTQKYSPKAAADVLQSGREALILREWLQKLTVQSVETGPGDRATSRASSVTRTGPKTENAGKRKRKSKKLDGFVISSDEEDNAMDEITDPEDNVASDADLGFFKKTVIRAGDVAKNSKDPARVTNAVVVSGPHGCGKTAAIYAVAKELDFEVFEINSSSRRSGKDILEKVGDMTRNHLVQRSQAPLSVNEDEKRIDDALAHDLQSGRQGTMNSFFQPKEAAKPKVKPTKPKPAPKKETNERIAPKPPPKQQKQSLILIEEADILYDADRGFWSTILELISQSKRPIIITCNDESVLPMDALTLYAVVRFVPPPIDLATDYMLLVAACEGHIIERGAVKTLYEGRNMDLRASLADLNFWCQFAVGDLKGGLDWFYPRWRPGSDIDASGETIRVVSENTYEAGMGWLSQDVLESHVHHLDIEEEMLHEAWDGWQLDVGDWQKNIGIGSWAKEIQKISNEKQDERFALRIYEDFAASMSEADLFSGGSFAPDNQVRPTVITSPKLLTRIGSPRCQSASTIAQGARGLYSRP